MITERKLMLGAVLLLAVGYVLFVRDPAKSPAGAVEQAVQAMDASDERRMAELIDFPHLIASLEGQDLSAMDPAERREWLEWIGGEGATLTAFLEHYHGEEANERSWAQEIGDENGFDVLRIGKADLISRSGNSAKVRLNLHDEGVLDTTFSVVVDVVQRGRLWRVVGLSELEELQVALSDVRKQRVDEHNAQAKDAILQMVRLGQMEREVDTSVQRSWFSETRTYTFDFAIPVTNRSESVLEGIAFSTTVGGVETLNFRHIGEIGPGESVVLDARVRLSDNTNRNTNRIRGLRTAHVGAVDPRYPRLVWRGADGPELINGGASWYGIREMRDGDLYERPGSDVGIEALLSGYVGLSTTPANSSF